MRKVFPAAVAAFVLFALSSTPATAFPGAMCFDGNGCGRCEVCVKERPYDPSGKCLVIQGCY